MQKLLSTAALIATLCALVQSSLGGEEERWEEPRPWLNSHNEPLHRGWLWRKPKPIVTRRPTLPSVKTTSKPPGPEICRNMRIVSRIEDEPGPVVCLRRNTSELMSQLKSIGGFIKRYTAVEVIDACGFEDLTAIELSPTVTRPPTTTTSSSSVQWDSQKVKRQSEKLWQSDTELQRRKRILPVSPGTVFRGCQGRGTIIDGTSEHRLCTECAATTRLGNDRFPRYINEVVCRDSDMQCAAKIGLCFQRNLKLPFLRSTGMFQFDALFSALTGKTVYKEVWEMYTQNIRSCCECGVHSLQYNKIVTISDD